MMGIVNMRMMPGTMQHMYEMPQMMCAMKFWMMFSKLKSFPIASASPPAFAAFCARRKLTRTAAPTTGIDHAHAGHDGRHEVRLEEADGIHDVLLVLELVSHDLSPNRWTRQRQSPGGRQRVARGPWHRK